MQSSSANSKARMQARKRMANDDAAYTGSGYGSTKRHASDRLDGEHKVKRKRVEPAPAAPANLPYPSHYGDPRISLVDFTKFPPSALNRYLDHFDLVPSVYPSPLVADDPLPPSILVNKPRLPSVSRAASPPVTTPTTSITPANRPKRDPKQAQREKESRRRSSRLLEDDLDTYARTPVRADVSELNHVLAGIAEKHFREVFSPFRAGEREVDTLAGFMCAVERWKNSRLDSGFP